MLARRGHAVSGALTIGAMVACAAACLVACGDEARRTNPATEAGGAGGEGGSESAPGPAGTPGSGGTDAGLAGEGGTAGESDDNQGGGGGAGAPSLGPGNLAGAPAQGGGGASSVEPAGGQGGEGGAASEPEPCVVLWTDTFADASGWEWEGDWQIAEARASEANDCGGGDPELDHTAGDDDLLAGTLVGGNLDVALEGPFYLTSPAVDTSTATSLTLAYWRQLTSDYPDYMIDEVEVWDGLEWQRLWSNPQLQRVDDGEWTLVTHDLSAYRGSETRVRFGYEVGMVGAYSCAGWSLDDISLGTNSCYAPPADAQ